MQILGFLVVIGIFFLLLALSPALAIAFLIIGILVLVMSNRSDLYHDEAAAEPSPPKVKWIKRNGQTYIVPVQVSKPALRRLKLTSAASLKRMLMTHPTRQKKEAARGGAERSEV